MKSFTHKNGVRGELHFYSCPVGCFFPRGSVERQVTERCSGTWPRRNRRCLQQQRLRWCIRRGRDCSPTPRRRSPGPAVKNRPHVPSFKKSRSGSETCLRADQALFKLRRNKKGSNALRSRTSTSEGVRFLFVSNSVPESAAGSLRPVSGTTVLRGLHRGTALAILEEKRGAFFHGLRAGVRPCT